MANEQEEYVNFDYIEEKQPSQPAQPSQDVIKKG